MQVGIGMFITGYTVDARTLARAIEAAGFDSVWVPDHAVLPANPVTPYRGGNDGQIPSLYGEMADPFVLLAYMGAVTSRLKLATGVCLLPERHPLTLAKTVSTLDNFSGGRVILGVGSGWLPEETELYGTSFATRWGYVGESVRAMQALWRDGVAAFEGKYVRFPAVRCDPLPAQQPYPPVVVGAPASERAWRRIAAWGDGWLPVMPSPQAVAEGRRALDAACRAVGRDPRAIEITAYVMDATLATQRAYEEAGADRIVVGIYNHPGTPLPYEQWHEVRAAALAAPPPPAGETLRVLARIAEQAQLPAPVLGSSL